MQWLNILELVFGIAAALGGAGAVLRYSTARTVIDLQREEIETREQRYDTLHEQYVECNAAAKAAEEKVKILQELTTGAPSIERLAMQMLEQHKETTGALADVTRELARLTEALTQGFELPKRRKTKRVK